MRVIISDLGGGLRSLAHVSQLPLLFFMCYIKCLTYPTVALIAESVESADSVPIQYTNYSEISTLQNH